MNYQKLPYRQKIYRGLWSEFGGLNHTMGCPEGKLYDMTNISADEYPILKNRKKRYKATEFQTLHKFTVDGQTWSVRPRAKNIISADGAWVIERIWRKENGILQECQEEPLWAVRACSYPALGNVDMDKANNGNLSDTESVQFGADTGISYSRMGPEKLELVSTGRYLFCNNGSVFRSDCLGYFDTLENAQAAVTTPKDGDVVAVNIPVSNHNNLNDEEAQTTHWIYYAFSDGKWATAGMPTKTTMRYVKRYVTFGDGTLYDEPAEANTMTLSSTCMQGLKAGDTIRVRGCQTLTKNNGWHTIREISEDRKTLRFDENIFQNGREEGVLITIECCPPVMDYICSCNNRIFGCTGDTIWACALGDPYNWWTYEGLSTDSWSVDVGSVGDFTACAAYDGDVYFFKENCFYRLYNTEQAPSKWVLSQYDYPGVKAGCHRSVAVADGAMYYLTIRGMYRFGGSVPACIQAPLGIDLPTDCVGGSDMTDYWACLRTAAGWEVFVFDTSVGAWYKHDQLQVLRFAYHDRQIIALCEKTKWVDNVQTTIWTEICLHGENSSYTAAGEDWDTKDSSLTFGVMHLYGAYKGAHANDRHLQQKLMISCFLGRGTELVVSAVFDNGHFEEIGRISEYGRKAHYIAIPPVRCDFCQIKLEADGDWWLYDISPGRLDGTEF